MDIPPSDLNQKIVALAKKNPVLKEIVTAYLLEIETDTGPLTWMQALEMMVCRLAEQYDGAMVNLLSANSSKCPVSEKIAIITDIE